MSNKNNKLSELEIRELFQKYDINKNNSVDQKELHSLVRDIYLKNHNIKDVKDLTQYDQETIKKSVEELMKVRDHNKDGSLQIDEFLSKHQDGDIVESIEKITDENRALVYGSRFVRAIRLNNIMIGSRPLAYASEVGESGRPLIPKYLVRALYGVSWAYIILDTASKTYSIKDQGREKMSLFSADLLLWHSLASMMIPALTIHSIVKYSGKVVKKYGHAASNFGRYGPTIFGLLSIPFIIHPIDNATDFAMNNTIRRFYNFKLPVIPKSHH